MIKNWDKIGMKQSPELEKKKSIKQQKEETLNFYRRAFCVDGNVKLVFEKLDKLVIIKNTFLKPTKAVIFKKI